MLVEIKSILLLQEKEDPEVPNINKEETNTYSRDNNINVSF